MASRFEPLALEALDVKIAFPAFEDATETPWDRYVMLNYLVRGRERRRRPLLDHGGRLSYWGIRNKNSTSEFFALTEEETLYHPAKYKTKLCTDVKKCREQAGWRLCPYAHSEEELRCELAKKYGYRDEFDTWRAKQKERDEHVEGSRVLCGDAGDSGAASASSCAGNAHNVDQQTDAWPDEAAVGPASSCAAGRASNSQNHGHGQGGQKQQVEGRAGAGFAGRREESGGQKTSREKDRPRAADDSAASADGLHGTVTVRLAPWHGCASLADASASLPVVDDTGYPVDMNSSAFSLQDEVTRWQAFHRYSPEFQRSLQIQHSSFASSSAGKSTAAPPKGTGFTTGSSCSALASSSVEAHRPLGGDNSFVNGCAAPAFDEDLQLAPGVSIESSVPLSDQYGNSVTVEDLFQFPDGRIVVYSSLDGACYGIGDVIRRSKKAYAEAQRREQVERHRKETDAKMTNKQRRGGSRENGNCNYRNGNTQQIKVLTRPRDGSRKVEVDQCDQLRQWKNPDARGGAPAGGEYHGRSERGRASSVGGGARHKNYASRPRQEQWTANNVRPQEQRKTAGRDDVSQKCWDRAEAGVPHSSTSRSKSFRKDSTTSSARAMASATNTSSTTALKGRKKGHWRNGGQGAESEAQSEGGGTYEGGGAHQSGGGGGGSASAARSRAAYNRSQQKQSVPSNNHPSQYNSRQSGPTTTGGIGQTLKPPLRVNTKVRSSYPHWYDRPVEFDRQYGWSWGGQKWGTHAYEERTWGRNSDSPRGGVHAANYASGGVLTGQPQAHYDEFGRSCRLDGGVLETYSCVFAGGAGTSTNSPGGNFPGDSRTRPIGTTEHARREGRSASAAAAGPATTVETKAPTTICISELPGQTTTKDMAHCLAARGFEEAYDFLHVTRMEHQRTMTCFVNFVSAGDLRRFRNDYQDFPVRIARRQGFLPNFHAFVNHQRQARRGKKKPSSSTTAPNGTSAGLENASSTLARTIKKTSNDHNQLQQRAPLWILRDSNRSAVSQILHSLPSMADAGLELGRDFQLNIRTTLEPGETALLAKQQEKEAGNGGALVDTTSVGENEKPQEAESTRAAKGQENVGGSTSSGSAALSVDVNIETEAPKVTEVARLDAVGINIAGSDGHDELPNGTESENHPFTKSSPETVSSCPTLARTSSSLGDSPESLAQTPGTEAANEEQSDPESQGREAVEEGDEKARRELEVAKADEITETTAQAAGEKNDQRKRSLGDMGAIELVCDRTYPHGYQDDSSEVDGWKSGGEEVEL